MIDKEMIERLKKNDTVTLCLSDEVLAAFRELRDNGAKIEWASDAGWLCGWTEFDGSGTYRLHADYELPEPEKKKRLVKFAVKPRKECGFLVFDCPESGFNNDFSERQDFPGYQGVIWEGYEDTVEHTLPYPYIDSDGHLWGRSEVEMIGSGKFRLHKPRYVVFLVEE